VLAETVEISADGLEYTFRLRKDVTWHDGKPFTADDVLFSYEAVPRFKTRTASVLSKVAEKVKVDDHTIRLRLAAPYLPFTLAMSGVNMPIIPRHIYEGTDLLTNPANANPIGTGPFKFKEFKRGEYIHLVRNENYFDRDRPFADEIYFPIIPDASQRAISVETGQTNILIPLTYNDQDLDRFVASGKFKVIPGAYDGVGPTTKISVNKRHPLLGDRRFRQAMMHAINRQQVVDSVYYGSARVMDGPFASATAYFDEAALKNRYPYDPARANALLEEMGLPDSAGRYG
jgi:peptide/nickel transport system substrate-binding protein